MDQAEGVAAAELAGAEAPRRACCSGEAADRAGEVAAGGGEPAAGGAAGVPWGADTQMAAETLEALLTTAWTPGAAQASRLASEPAPARMLE